MYPVAKCTGVAEIVYISIKCIQLESVQEWQKLYLCLPSVSIQKLSLCIQNVFSWKAYRRDRYCLFIYKVYSVGKRTGVAEIVPLSIKCIQEECVQERQRYTLCLPSVFSTNAYRDGRNSLFVYQVYSVQMRTGVAEIVPLSTKCIQ